MPRASEPPPAFEVLTLAELDVEDEASFAHVRLYTDLKEVLLRANTTFRVLPASQRGRWDRALFLNLTFWGTDDGGDVLVDRTIPADVVAHVAWHHLAARALPAAQGGRPSPEALLFGEAIASAFDVYLVGRLLGHAPGSSFLETQVPAMADAAADAGATDAELEALLAEIAKDPEAAFESLRGLLYRASLALFACSSAAEALAVLDRADREHPYAMLLHRFELSNWVLYARAYGAERQRPDPRVEALDHALAGPDGGLPWLEKTWLAG